VSELLLSDSVRSLAFSSLELFGEFVSLTPNSKETHSIKAILKLDKKVVA